MVRAQIHSMPCSWRSTTWVVHPSLAPTLRLLGVESSPSISAPDSQLPFLFLAYQKLPSVRSIHSIQDPSGPVHSIPFRSIPFHPFPPPRSIPFHPVGVPFHSIVSPFHSIPFHSIPLCAAARALTGTSAPRRSTNTSPARPGCGASACSQWDRLLLLHASRRQASVAKLKLPSGDVTSSPCYIVGPSSAQLVDEITIAEHRHSRRHGLHGDAHDLRTFILCLEHTGEQFVDMDLQRFNLPNRAAA